MFFSDSKIEKFKDWINESENFLIMGHKKPDGDSSGSVLAISNYLNSLNKKNTVFFTEKSYKLDFLPNYYEAITDSKELHFNQYDCFIFCDMNDLNRTGIDFLLGPILKKKTKKIINIDHHVGKAHWANLVFSVEEAASTTSIIYDIFKQANLNISSDMATCLLTGLFTDTSFLLNKATTAESFLMAEDLVNLGANEKIIKNTLQNLSPQALKAVAEILNTMQYRPEWNLVIARISQELLDKYNLKEEDLEITYYLLLLTKRHHNLLLIKDNAENKFLRGSWRTTAEVNVGRLARIMGGGGHEKAAGFAVQNYKI